MSITDGVISGMLVSDTPEEDAGSGPSEPRPVFETSCDVGESTFEVVPSSLLDVADRDPGPEV